MLDVATPAVYTLSGGFLAEGPELITAAEAVRPTELQEFTENGVGPWLRNGTTAAATSSTSGSSPDMGENIIFLNLSTRNVFPRGS